LVVEIAIDFIAAEVRCIESYRWGCKENGEGSEVLFIFGKAEAFESSVGAVEEFHGASAYRW
jgi:hypothetical protein